MDEAREEAARRLAGLDAVARELLELHRASIERRAAFLQREVARELTELSRLSDELTEVERGDGRGD